MSVKLQHNEWDNIRKVYYENMDDIMAHCRERRNSVINPYLMDWNKIFTPIERLVWCSLRGEGVSMYPQFPVNNCFIDFANPALKIGLEVDGKDYHCREKDKLRDEMLMAYGWKIFRISGAEAYRERPDEGECMNDGEVDYDQLKEWMLHTADGIVRALWYVYIEENRNIYDGLPYLVLDTHRLAQFQI